ncbi:MAG TPA: TauD/TfdA family dioxygenase [Candidatus Binatia bacterium]|nr:TauD/TfdA family dioxygenase [Candidatus Binatia bacterium]
MNRSQLEIQPVAGRIGAEIVGIDLRADLDDEVVEAIRSALLLWKVVFFRGQRLDPDTHAGFARRFGPITTAHPTVPGLAENRHVLDIDAADSSVASVWHTDVTFVDRPPLGSILRALVVPPYGGDTLWANTAAAYEDLPRDLREAADGLHAVHTNEFDYSAPPRPDDDDKLRRYAAVFQSVRYETTHPVVRVHPETGERALLLGGFARRIVGVSEGESAALLRRFRGRVERPENVVRWRWRLGDVAFWDNRSTQHRAIADFGRAARRLQRVTIAGDVPVGINGIRSRALDGDSTAYQPSGADA